MRSSISVVAQSPAFHSDVQPVGAPAAGPSNSGAVYCAPGSRPMGARGASAPSTPTERNAVSRLEFAALLKTPTLPESITVGVSER